MVVNRITSQRAERHGTGVNLFSSDAGRFSDHPVFKPSPNQPSDRMPTANVESPMMRIQRKFAMTQVCMNSAERAYHMPCATLDQVCMRPTGNKLSNTINGRPM